MLSKDKIIKATPHYVLNPAITIYNSYLYKMRHGGEYQAYREYYAAAENFDETQLKNEIEKKKTAFFTYVKNNSPWYKNYDFKDFQSLKVLNKIDIINHLDKIKTIDERDGRIASTGGTTGASMKVIYTRRNMQERFAILDHFRAKHGYHLGEKVAWFSGKDLISEKDIAKGVCSHYDFLNKIRFYSTFFINEENFDVYWSSLNTFKPKFIVGFPSSVYELCQIADSKGLSLKHKVKVFFPTAETVLPAHRESIKKVLGCELVDQYASSEGAPFILECSKGKLHIHPLTGIFEVVDENMQPTDTGELLVTSFTTYGTPLIRYRIGDSIKMAPKDKACTCGSIFPLVDSIVGRATDYILSPTKGKISMANISNSTKGVDGIIKFQVIQNHVNEVQVSVVANDKFVQTEREKLHTALSNRFGSEMIVSIETVKDIANEKSSKFRVVKNNITGYK